MSLSLGRTQWMGPKVIAQFKRLARMKGFTNSTIWILPRQGEHCPGQAGTSCAHQCHHFVV